MTEYVVLGSYEGEWTEAGLYRQRSAQGAIRACLEMNKEELPERIRNTDLFVAVPARSWKPVTVKVETKTALKFS